MLESWLAFAGAAAPLSRARPGVPVLNLDIGGGTTNPAVGIDGDVVAAGCLHVGARHVRVRPGTLEVTGTSELGRALLDEAGGDPAAVVARMVRALEDLVLGRPVDPLLVDVADAGPGGRARRALRRRRRARLRRPARRARARSATSAASSPPRSGPPTCSWATSCPSTAAARPSTA